MITPGTRLEEGDEVTEILATPAETGDRYRLRLEVEAGGGPGVSGLGPHVHPAFIEVFECVSGRMTARLGRERLEVAPGESLTVPVGTLHGFVNLGDGPLTLDVELIFTPPGPRREADLVEFGVVHDELLRVRRATGRQGDLPLLQMAVLMRAYPLAMRMPGPFGYLIPPLAWLGRLRGYRAPTLAEI